MSEHPVRVGPEAYAGIKARAERDGITVKEAADRLVREALAPATGSTANDTLAPDVLRRAQIYADRHGSNTFAAVNCLVRIAGARLDALAKYEARRKAGPVAIALEKRAENAE